MNQQIAAYLEGNKALYSREVLIEQLAAAGYQAADIDEAVKYVYEGHAQDSQATKNFWDFRSVKVYINASEKTKDFFFGLLAPIVIGFIVSLLFNLLGLEYLGFGWFLVEIAALVYFYGRRRYVFYGLLAKYLLGLVLVLGILLIFALN